MIFTYNVYMQYRGVLEGDIWQEEEEEEGI